MSWWANVWIGQVGDTDKSVKVCDINVTYNLGPMFREAFDGVGFRDFNNMKAKDALPILRGAVEAMKNDPDRFKKHNPSNGWGDYEGAMETLAVLLDGCEHAMQVSPDLGWVRVS